MNLKNIVLGIAIIILTIFVTWYGISMFYPSVEYTDFCSDAIIQEINGEAECIEVGGKWSVYEEEIKCISFPCPQGWCDRDYYCRQEYDSAKEERAKKVFFITIPLGIFVIILGSLLFGLESVGVGLMGGGIGTFIYGAGGYWEYGDNWFRFLISLLGLLAVIYLAYWFERKFKKKKKN